MVLEAFEKAIKMHARDHRLRIEHCSVVDSSILKKIKELNVVIVPHSYLYEHGDKIEEYGEYRWNMMFPKWFCCRNGHTCCRTLRLSCQRCTPLNHPVAANLGNDGNAEMARDRAHVAWFDETDAGTAVSGRGIAVVAGLSWLNDSIAADCRCRTSAPQPSQDWASGLGKGTTVPWSGSGDVSIAGRTITYASPGAAGASACAPPVPASPTPEATEPPLQPSISGSRTEQRNAKRADERRIFNRLMKSPRTQRVSLPSANEAILPCITEGG